MEKGKEYVTPITTSITWQTIKKAIDKLLKNDKEKKCMVYINDKTPQVMKVGKKMNNIRVSVIIPCYNSAEWIEKCLKSIPKRDDIEIICIDDGSTDETLEKLLNYQEKHPNNFQIITCIKNKGVSHARNQGIDVADGKYILMLDSDDYIYPKVFNEIVDSYLDKDYDMVFYDMENNVKYRFLANQNNYQCKYGNFKFIRKEFLGNMRYVEGMQYAEDKDLHLKLMKKYPYCYFTHQLMYHYNYPRNGSLSAIGEKR